MTFFGKLQHAEELAKWDEKKKWEKKVHSLQNKLKERDGRLEALEKADKGLRELLKRMERRLAAGQLRSQQARPSSGPAATGRMAENSFSDVEHGEAPNRKDEDELEQLRLEVKEMRLQCQQLSNALAAAEPSSEPHRTGTPPLPASLDEDPQRMQQAEDRIAKLKANLAAAHEDHLQTKLSLQEARLEIVRLSEEKKMLELDAELRQSAQKDVPESGRRLSATNMTMVAKKKSTDGRPLPLTMTRNDQVQK